MRTKTQTSVFLKTNSFKFKKDWRWYTLIRTWPLFLLGLSCVCDERSAFAYITDFLFAAPDFQIDFPHFEKEDEQKIAAFFIPDSVKSLRRKKDTHRCCYSFSYSIFEGKFCFLSWWSALLLHDCRNFAYKGTSVKKMCQIVHYFAS